MQHGDFTIGSEFLYGERRWRCTDIGTRVIVAIRLDQTEVCTLDDWGKTPVGRRTTSRSLDQTEAAREGWFNGPPYAVEEVVFDEYHIEACEPALTKGSDFDRSLHEIAKDLHAVGALDKETMREFDAGCLIAERPEMPELTEADYDRLVTVLDALLERVRGDENHPLRPLLHYVGDLIAAYDKTHHPPETSA